MEHILITGGAGFIGSNLALKLIEKGYQVTVLDKLSKQIHGEKPEEDSPLYLSIRDKVKFINACATDRAIMEKLLEQQDVVVHLVAETGTGQSMYEIEKYVNINIGSTALLLDILANKKHAVKKLIVASSRSIYGEGKYHCQKCGIVYPLARKDNDMQNSDFECKCPYCAASVKLLPTDEESKIHPTSIYGITKQNQEQMVLVACKSLKIPAVALRYQNVYGPGQSLSNPYTGILSIFSTQIKNGNHINIFEDGLESRDFVYIDDVVEATILGIEKPEADFQAFNVGADQSINVLSVAQALKQKYNSNVDIKITKNYRLGDIRHNYADLSKIKKMLGFSPQWNFDRGITAFTNWVNIQKVQEDKYSKSIEEMKQKGLYK